MKTIEEKAKAYDEALDKAKQFSEKPYLEDSKGIVEYLFPELKESEDERIRKFIANELVCLRAAADKGDCRYEELSNAINWLEKKGNTQKEIDDAYLKGISDAKKELEKQGEQKQEKCEFFEHWSDEQTRRNLISFVNIWGKAKLPLTSVNRFVNYLEKQGEKKPVWSEEDEEIISVLNAYAEVAENDDCPLNAERIRKAVGKFKSLRHQSHWRPSEEQITALRVAIGDEQGSDCCYELRSLLKDLKSL